MESKSCRNLLGYSAPVQMEAMEGRLMLAAAPPAPKPPPPPPPPHPPQPPKPPVVLPLTVETITTRQAGAHFQFSNNGIQTDLYLTTTLEDDQTASGIIEEPLTSVNITVKDTINGIPLASAQGTAPSSAMFAADHKSAHLRTFVELFDSKNVSFIDVDIDMTWKAAAPKSNESKSITTDPGNGLVTALDSDLEQRTAIATGSAIRLNPPVLPWEPTISFNYTSGHSQNGFTSTEVDVAAAFATGTKAKDAQSITQKLFDAAKNGVVG